jgi:hypothetical protein
MPLQEAFGMPCDSLRNQREPFVSVADLAIKLTEAYGKN